MLNFILCDDNQNILNRLEKILDTIFVKNNFDAEISLKTDDYNEVIEYINNNKVDVVLLDINLKSNKTGLQVAEQIRKINKNIYIIFTTGHLEYAMVAYKYKTFDYIANLSVMIDWKKLSLDYSRILIANQRSISN